MKQAKNIKEEWKVVKEFPIYSVSNLGRLRNDITKNILVGGYDKDGYRQATICYNGKQYNRRLCRLVAIAFLPNPNNLPVVNHKDENKENDFVDNLEWCTVEYNNSYGSKIKQIKCIETNEIFGSVSIASKTYNIDPYQIYQSCRKGYGAKGYHWTYVDNIENYQLKNTTAKYKKKVRCIDTNEVFDSISQASQETDCPLSSISACCHGRAKSTNGLHWEFIEINFDKVEY